MYYWVYLEMTQKRRQNGCEFFTQNPHCYDYLCIIDDRAKKLLNLRVFENPANGKQWDKSVLDLGLEILCVSQVRESVTSDL